MTYREIFLQADPYAVNEAIGSQEVEFKGRKIRFKTQHAFDICKGLKFFAQGAILDESAEETLAKTLQTNPRLTTIQARVLITGLKGYLNATCEALGFNQTPNPDKSVNEWLDQSASNGIEDANKLATNIISELLQNREYYGQ